MLRRIEPKMLDFVSARIDIYIYISIYIYIIPLTCIYLILFVSLAVTLDHATFDFGKVPWISTGNGNSQGFFRREVARTHPFSHQTLSGMWQQSLDWP